jgi:hypothetical protein
MKEEIKLRSLEQNHDIAGGLGIRTTPLKSQKKNRCKGK